MESATPRSTTPVRPGNGAAPPVSAKPGYVGKRIGRFRIIALIGKGAMGSVFRAEDVDLQRHVALKVILDKSVAGRRPSDKVEQFIREARSAARLEHPHVVAIYEVNRTADIHYIAMELVEGGNLHELISAGPMDVVRACQLGAEAAEALQYAHEQGVIHRDVKPANLMLARNGRCKLADFGLAHIDDPSDSFSMHTVSVGTPLYAAPEVFRHEPSTARSDVYSLGATLYHLLTGSPPYPGESSAEVMRHHLHSPVPDLLAVQPGLPASLAAAIAKALAKDPADRYESAGQFARVLRLHTVPLGSPGISGAWTGSVSMSENLGGNPGSSFTHLARKKPSPALWIGIATGVAALMVGGVFAVNHFRSPPNPLATLPQPPAGRPAPAVPLVPVPAEQPPPLPGATEGNGSSAAPAAIRLPSALPASPKPSLPGPPAGSTPSSSGSGTEIAVTDNATLLSLARKEDPRAASEVTVIGTVKDVVRSNTGKVYYVNFDGVDKDGFTCIYFPSVAEKFKAAFPGEKDLPGLFGKKVRVRGRVELFKDKDRAEIILKSPDQIKIEG